MLKTYVLLFFSERKLFENKHGKLHWIKFPERKSRTSWNKKLKFSVHISESGLVWWISQLIILWLLFLRVVFLMNFIQLNNKKLQKNQPLWPQHLSSRYKWPNLGQHVNKKNSSILSIAFDFWKNKNNNGLNKLDRNLRVTPQIMVVIWKQHVFIRPYFLGGWHWEGYLEDNPS